MAEMLVQLPDGEIIPDPDEAFFDELAAGGTVAEEPDEPITSA